MRTLDDLPLAANERQAIEAAAATLRARFPIAEIVLYGSKARGDSDPESDIDLLVLTSRPLDAEEQRRISGDLREIDDRYEVLLSAFTIDARSWREGMHAVMPIHAEVEREGVLCRPDGLVQHQDVLATAPLSRAARETLVRQVVDHWMQMGDEALASARADLDAKRYRSAINRAYYAAFYAVSAVLLQQGRHFVKHAGVQAAVHRDLVHPGLLAAEYGKAYDTLLELRLIADYTTTGMDAEQAARSLRQAEALVAEMRRLLSGAS